MTPEQLTAKVRSLPDSTRHVVAGIVAWKLSPRDRLEDSASFERDCKPWREMWDMVTDHDCRYEWPTTADVAQALRACGLNLNMFVKALATYNSYGDDVKTAAVFRHHTDSHDTIAEASARRRELDKYDLCEVAL